MPATDRKNTGARTARFAIWTVRHQQDIIARIRRYIWIASFAAVASALLGLISLESAIYGIFIGGTSLLLAFWAAVERRRTWLLNIRDPHLRCKAHHAMLQVLEARGHRLPPSADRCPAACRAHECPAP